MNTISRLQGLTLEEFNQHIQEGNIQVLPARLIPFDRAGDEMALTSVFLSALRMIREFKVSLTKDYGRVFAAPGKFIEALESDSLDFYRLLVQHLEKWQEKAPEAKEKPVGYKQVEEEKKVVQEAEGVEIQQVLSGRNYYG